MEKEPVHELREENGKLVVYRLKPPVFHVVYDDEKHSFENSDINEALLKKAKAFVNSKLRKKGTRYDHR